jgi:hypothetical protein
MSMTFYECRNLLTIILFIPSTEASSPRNRPSFVIHRCSAIIRTVSGLQLGECVLLLTLMEGGAHVGQRTLCPDQKVRLRRMAFGDGNVWSTCLLLSSQRQRQKRLLRNLGCFLVDADHVAAATRSHDLNNATSDRFMPFSKKKLDGPDVERLIIPQKLDLQSAGASRCLRRSHFHMWDHQSLTRD